MSKEDVLELSLRLIRRFEGVSLVPYLCSAGVPTIGFGSTYYEDGTKVTLKDPPISRDLAEILLRNTVSKQYFPAVVARCPLLTDPNKIAALVSWTYNLGVNALKTSTLRKKVQEEKWEEAAKEILKWDKARGKTIRGLTVRRQAEAKLFLYNKE